MFSSDSWVDIQNELEQRVYTSPEIGGFPFSGREKEESEDKCRVES